MALLRGINLGKRRVTNARLAELFELAGCEGVSTFQAAGNVLFDHGPGAAVIRATLEDGLGYSVSVYLRTATEMARIAGAPPFPDVDLQPPGSLLVTFFDVEVPKAVEAASNDIDVLRADGRELYWLAHNGVANTTLDWRPVGKQLADPGTNRNITTVRKLAVKLAGNLGDAPAELLPNAIEVVRRVAADVESECGACRALTNLGRDQDSKHLHFHVNSGDPIR